MDNHSDNAHRWTTHHVRHCGGPTAVIPWMGRNTMIGRCWPVSDDGHCGGPVVMMGIVVIW